MAAPTNVGHILQPVRDNEFWFEDGTVVMVAGETAFRVYGGQLSRHSEALRNLISSPPTAPGLPILIDGCPVRLVTGSEADFRALLSVLCSDTGLAEAKMPFATVASLVRTGHKYGIQSILREGMRRVESCFVTDLSDWNHRVEHNSPLVVHESNDAPQALRLFRLTGIDTYLPAVVYECSDLDTSFLFNPSLSDSDVILCIEARGVLQDALIDQARRSDCLKGQEAQPRMLLREGLRCDPAVLCRELPRVGIAALLCGAPFLPP